MLSFVELREKVVKLGTGEKQVKAYRGGKRKKLDVHICWGQTTKKTERMTNSVNCWSPELWTRPNRSARPPQIFPDFWS